MTIDNHPLTPKPVDDRGAGLGDYQIEMTEDKPVSGMWHCGPNAAWVTVTHLPTMISARAFDQSHHAAKQAAQACCEMMVDQSRLSKCQFPERVSP
jgi:hypothetical protein